MPTKTAYAIRMLVKGHWEDSFWAFPSKAEAIKKMNAMQREYKRMGFKGTEGYDLAVFHGRKKVAETKR